MRKKIVMYFHKRPLTSDPFVAFDKKHTVYHSFFKRGIELGFDMFIASGVENYRSPGIFQNVLKYNGFLFESFPSDITADAIFDRSGGLQFPDKTIDDITLNQQSFKAFCSDKNAMQKLLGEHMPKSFAIHNQDELSHQLDQFTHMQRAVLKPANGMKGQDIVIDTPENISQVLLKNSQNYTLQEFVDTSMGIPHICPSYHDLRIIIANKKIVLCHVRTPKAGILLSNVALGGSIHEVAIEHVPSFVLDIVKQAQNRIETVFDNPLYSIDIGIQNQCEAFIFEINDRIGFPSESMNYASFVENILESLAIRTLRPH